MPAYGFQGPLRPVALSVIPTGLAPTDSYSVVLETKLFVFSNYTILFLAFLMVCFLGLGCPSPPDSPANLLFLDSTQVSTSLKPHRQSLFSSVHHVSIVSLHPKDQWFTPPPLFFFLFLPSFFSGFICCRTFPPKNLKWNPPGSSRGLVSSASRLSLFPCGSPWGPLPTQFQKCCTWFLTP